MQLILHLVFSTEKVEVDQSRSIELMDIILSAGASTLLHLHQ